MNYWLSYRSQLYVKFSYHEAITIEALSLVTNFQFQTWLLETLFKYLRELFSVALFSLAQNSFAILLNDSSLGKKYLSSKIGRYKTT